jgi:DNA modification methylase
MNNGMNQINKVIHGDCLEALKEMPDNSVDAVVTDPPYGLSKEPDIKEVLTKWMNGEPYNHKHNGFMGKEWDSFVPHPDVWKEVYRVLKPGGHLLCFAGTRTQDLMTISLRLGGFEVRDVVQYLYFSGFPKSMDVGKALDKRGGVMVDFEEFRDACIGALQKPGKTRKQLQKLLGNHMLSHYLTRGSQPAVPVYRDYVIIRDYLELGDRFDKYFKEAAEREKIGKGAIYGWEENKLFDGKHNGKFGFKSDYYITAPATELAKRWNGWGTALKPAHEPIIMARKPIEKNVAYNVEKYGTGAINIDGCRIWDENKAGRFPANCITTERDAFFSKYFNVTPPELCKKASKKDRNSDWRGEEIGLEEKPERTLGGGKMLTGSGNERKNKFKNHHPTVKPVDLMAWLVRLITPPGGVVLDPFAGSGSTLVAAKREGFQYIGIELNPEYIEIAKTRLNERGNVNER